MKKTLAISIAAATLLAGGTLYAQTAERGGDMTRAEATERADKAFERMDVNDDGVLDQADREARQRTLFDRVDADSNGAISFAEFKAAREERRGERSEMRGRGHHRGGFGRIGHMVERADTNNDGTISQAEFRTAALTRFDRADADKDGTVTAEERRTMRDQMRGGHRGPAS